nr:MAG TPA: hypothetical protein [Caudoviricetes sp.]
MVGGSSPPQTACVVCQVAQLDRARKLFCGSCFMLCFVGLVLLSK